MTKLEKIIVGSIAGFAGLNVLGGLGLYLKDRHDRKEREKAQERAYERAKEEQERMAGEFEEFRNCFKQLL